MSNRLEVRNTAPAGDWRKHMECTTEDPTRFAGDTRTIEGRRGIREAKKVCYGCAAINNCAHWALQTEQPDEVWGGMDPDQRRQALDNGGRELAADMRAYPDPSKLNQIRHLGRAGVVPVTAANYTPLPTTAKIIPLQPTVTQVPDHTLPSQAQSA